MVHIHFGGSTTERTENTEAPGKEAKLAIILDDLGSDRRAAREIFDLPFPLTVSVLPNHEHSEEIAEEAQRRGYQVMLHLPMQAVANEKPEAQELHRGMGAFSTMSTWQGRTPIFHCFCPPTELLFPAEILSRLNLSTVFGAGKVWII